MTVDKIIYLPVMQPGILQVSTLSQTSESCFPSRLLLPLTECFPSPLTQQTAFKQSRNLFWLSEISQAIPTHPFSFKGNRGFLFAKYKGRLNE